MKDIIYQVIGRVSLCSKWFRPILALKQKKTRQDKETQFDKTGLVVKEAHPMKILWKDSEILFIEYDSLAHSFWRAQEFSLFTAHLGLLQNPLLDFGCGDGSFASVLFKEIDYGIDYNAEALRVAKRYGIYKRLLQSSNFSIPLEKGSVQSIISNSVLEHLVDLDRIISEISRILIKGGIFMFTVPVTQFQHDFAKYFGSKESRRINNEYYHRNLLEVDRWKELLNNHGFLIITLKQYQPDWFTFWYRMFGLLKRLPGIELKVWKHYNLQIINMVRRSVTKAEKGGNIFVITKKLGH